MSATLKERFEAKFTKGPDDECWMWQGAKNKKGYGKIGGTGRRLRNLYAHRVSYQLYRGEIADGMCICHVCDLPSCVNPNHLFQGSAKDNTRDCIKKGRARRGFPKGEINGRAKLTVENVIAIRKATDSGPVLARAYGVNRQTIGRIRRGIDWKHILEGTQNA